MDFHIIMGHHTIMLPSTKGFSNSQIGTPYANYCSTVFLIGIPKTNHFIDVIFTNHSTSVTHKIVSNTNYYFIVTYIRIPQLSHITHGSPDIKNYTPVNLPTTTLQQSTKRPRYKYTS